MSVDTTHDSLQLTPRTTPGVPGDQRFTTRDLVPLPGLGFYSVATPPGLDATPLLANQPEGETRQTIGSLRLSYDFDSVTLQSITGYVKTEDFFTTDFSGVGVIAAASDIDNDHWSQELQLQGSAIDDRLSYVLGAYYFRETGNQDFGWFLFVPTSTSQITASTTSIAGFGQADWRFTDALKGTLGLRWVQDRKDFDIAFQGLPLGQLLFGAPASDEVALESRFSQFTPRFGLDYTFDPVGPFDSLMGFVSAARGFKSGGFNGINITNVNVARQGYDPEFNWTYEVGFKADMLDRRLRVNANYFLTKITDLTLNARVEVLPGVFDFPVQNAGAATIRGLEVEVTAVPTPDLTLFAVASFLTGRFDELDPTSAPAQAVTAFNIARPDVPQLPDYSFTIGFDYGWDVRLGGRPARFRLGADYYRTDDYVVGATNDFLISAYGRTSAYAGLELGEHWDIRFDVRNLSNNEVINSGDRGLGGLIALPPREYRLSLRYRL